MVLVGRGSSDSCFPSALSQLQSASRSPAQGITGAEQQSGAQRGAGAKIPPIRRSSQFVLPYPRCSSGVSGPLVQCYVQIWSPAVNELPPSGSDYAFSSLFPAFSPQPSSAEFCCAALSMLAQLPWLVQVLSPPCNLRLGMLNGGHSCTGVYISTCCSPHHEQSFAQLYGTKGCFHSWCTPFSFTRPHFFWTHLVFHQKCAPHPAVSCLRLQQRPLCTIYGGDWKELPVATRNHTLLLGLLERVRVCFVSSSASGWRALALYAGYWLRKDDKLLRWLSAVC